MKLVTTRLGTRMVWMPFAMLGDDLIGGLGRELGGWVVRCCWFVLFLFYTPYEREIVLAIPTTSPFEPMLR